LAQKEQLQIPYSDSGQLLSGYDDQSLQPRGNAFNLSVNGTLIE